MRPVAISAVLLSVAHVSFGAAAMPAAGAMPLDDSGSVTLARAGASTFLDLPETRQSALLPVGEGGEGGRGRWRRGPPGYAYGWAPPPRAYYYAPPPPRYYRPPPRAYYAPPPPVYYAPPPPMYYAPQPGVSLNFRF